MRRGRCGLITYCFLWLDLLAGGWSFSGLAPNTCQKGIWMFFGLSLFIFPWSSSPPERNLAVFLKYTLRSRGSGIAFCCYSGPCCLSRYIPHWYHWSWSWSCGVFSSITTWEKSHSAESSNNGSALQSLTSTPFQKATWFSICLALSEAAFG